MNTETATIIGCALLALPFIFIFAGVLRKRIYSAKVEAMGISSYKDIDHDDDGRTCTSYTNTYSYKYKGISHVISIRSQSRDMTNKKCIMRINPKKPEKADGSSSLLIAIGCGLLLVMMSVYFALR